MDGPPRWRRRKTARPGEITQAALGVFAEQGFAAAKLTKSPVGRASRRALYLYFETKEELFRAAARPASPEPGTRWPARGGL